MSKIVKSKVDYNKADIISGKKKVGVLYAFSFINKSILERF